MSRPNHIKPMADHYAILCGDRVIGIVEPDYHINPTIPHWTWSPLAGGEPHLHSDVSRALAEAREYEPSQSY